MRTTIAILDLAHHGTTMLAGCYEILGVPMVGLGLQAKRMEDPLIIRALQDEHAFATVVAARSHRAWGFKYPGAWLYADLLGKYLVDPLYLAIYKDPVSVTWRRANGVSYKVLMNTIKQMKESVAGIHRSGLPCHWLSYYRAITDPDTFVGHLVEIAGLDADAEQMKQAIDYIQPSAGYRGVEGPQCKW